METSKLSRLNQNILKLMLINLYKSLLEDGSENPNVYNINDDDNQVVGLEMRLIEFDDGGGSSSYLQGGGGESRKEVGWACDQTRHEWGKESASSLCVVFSLVFFYFNGL